MLRSSNYRFSYAYFRLLSPIRSSSRYFRTFASCLRRSQKISSSSVGNRFSMPPIILSSELTVSHCRWRHCGSNNCVLSHSQPFLQPCDLFYRSSGSKRYRRWIFGEGRGFHCVMGNSKMHCPAQLQTPSAIGSRTRWGENLGVSSRSCCRNPTGSLES